MGHSLPKVPDAISPFTLGNQIIIYQDFQRENAIRFFEDLAQGARDIIPPPPGEWPWWVWALIIAGGGTAVGVAGLYLYQFLPKPPSRSSNGSRKRKPKKIKPKTRQISPTKWRAEIRSGDREIAGFGPTEEDAIRSAERALSKSNARAA